MRVARAPFGWVVLLVAACTGEQPGPIEPGPKPPVVPVLGAAVVSQPITAASASQAAVSSGPLVYVSLAPGTLTDGRSVIIRNRATGAQVVKDMVNGGWDPVSLGAETGDTIGFTITAVAGEPLEFISIVPGRRRPVVVRTQPPPGKRDVPLNATLLVVFSEPMDPATINGGSIQLTRDGVVVPATVAPVAGTPSSVELLPEALEPGVTYVLTVTTNAASQSTELLGSPVIVSFTTEPAPSPLPSGRVAFARAGIGNQQLYVLDLATRIVTQLTSGQQLNAEPAWSSDGRRIAFTREGGVWVMNADGTGQVRLGDGHSPASSRDSTGRIAFLSRGPSFTGITVVNEDGSGSIQTITLPPFDIDLGGLSWSPDGRTFAFHASNNTPLSSVGMLEEMETVLLINADGSNLRRLTSPCTYTPGDCNFWSAESSPSWSPDGSRIAFWSWRLGLGVVSAQGGPAQGVTSAAWSDRFGWSPDGTWIVHSLSGSLWAFLAHDPWNIGQQLPGTAGAITPSWTGAATP